MHHHYDVNLSALTLGVDLGQAVDESETTTLVVTGETEELPGLPPGFIAPGAVPVRVDHWDLGAQPFAAYVPAFGDTFVGLAATYLGDGSRWPDIWNTGGNSSKYPNPDVIDNLGPIDMPDEARDNLKSWLKKGGPPGVVPGKTPPSKTAKAAKKLWPWLVGGAAIGLVAAAAMGPRRRG